MKKTSKLVTLSSLAIAGILTFSACGSTTANSSASGSASSSNAGNMSASADAASAQLKVESAWAKATEGGMTGVFGKITNTSDQDIKIVAASSSATDEVQLHTTVKDSDGNTKMQQVQELVVKAGQTLELKPGSDHIMLMNMNCSLVAGASTTITLKTEDGATLEFKPQARDYSGAQEEYQGDAHSTGSASAGSSASEDSHSDHEHSGHDHDHDHGQGMQEGEHSGHEHMSGGASASSSAMPQCQ